MVIRASVHKNSALEKAHLPALALLNLFLDSVQRHSQEVTSDKIT